MKPCKITLQKCFKRVKIDRWPELPYSFSTIDCCVRINHEPDGLLNGDMQSYIQTYSANIESHKLIEFTFGHLVHPSSFQIVFLKFEFPFCFSIHCRSLTSLPASTSLKSLSHLRTGSCTYAFWRNPCVMAMENAHIRTICMTQHHSNAEEIQMWCTTRYPRVPLYQKLNHVE